MDEVGRMSMEKKFAVLMMVTVLLGLAFVSGPAFAAGGSPRAVGVVDGLVLDNNTFAGISGATVSFTPGGPNTTADANGYFNCTMADNRTYTVTASAAGYYSKQVFILLGIDEHRMINFTLDPIPPVNGTLRGYVFDNNTMAWLPATVTVTPGNYQAVANDSFYFSLAGNRYYNATASYSGYNSQTKAFYLASNDTVFLNFTLDKTVVNGTLSGYVFDSVSGYVIGAKVTVNPGGYQTLANASYRMSLAGGKYYNATASYDGYDSVTKEFYLASNGTAFVNFTLSKTIVNGTVRGWVFDNNTLSWLMATVTVTPGNYQALANDSYSLKLAGAKYYNATASYGGYTSQTKEFYMPSGGTVYLNFTIDKIILNGTLWGYVFDSVSGYVIGAKVTVTPGNTEALANASYRMSLHGDRYYNATASYTGYDSVTRAFYLPSNGTVMVNFTMTKTIVNGTVRGWVFDNNTLTWMMATVTVTPGNYQTVANDSYHFSLAGNKYYNATASLSGYTSQTKEFYMPSGGTVYLNFTIDKIILNGTLWGYVFDSVSGYVIGAKVTVTPGNTEALANASYRMSLYGDRYYNATASYTGYDSVTRAFYLPSNGTVMVNFTMTRKLVPLSCKIFDSKGKALPASTVNIAWDGGNKTVTTDSSGSFSVEVPGAPSYTMTISAPGYKTTTVDFTPSSAQTLTSVNLQATKQPVVTTDAPMMMYAVALVVGFAVAGGLVVAFFRRGGR